MAELVHEDEHRAQDGEVEEVHGPARVFVPLPPGVKSCRGPQAAPRLPVGVRKRPLDYIRRSSAWGGADHCASQARTHARSAAPSWSASITAASMASRSAGASPPWRANERAATRVSASTIAPRRG